MRNCHVTHLGECTRVMSNASILETLAEHGVRTHLSTPTGLIGSAVVMAYEEVTVKGPDGVVRDASEWIEAPKTAHDLAAWLGY